MDPSNAQDDAYRKFGCKCVKGRRIHNILLTVTNLYALRAIIVSRSPILTPILILSMTFSSMYHLCERNYRSHNLSGPRVIIFPSFLKRFLRDPTNPPAISPVNEEKLLLSLDRAFSLLAVGGIFLTCGFRTIAAVSTTIETAWVGPTAVTCLVLSELLGNKWVLAYSILHSAWHILVYHLPYICVSVSLSRGEYRPFVHY